METYRISLEETTNQYGDQVDTNWIKIDPKTGKPVKGWTRHNAATFKFFEEISLPEYLELAGGKVTASDLPDAVFSAEHPSPRRLVLQRTGFRTLRELAGWVATCYRLGINPLPKLRERLPELDIRFVPAIWDDRLGELLAAVIPPPCVLDRPHLLKIDGADGKIRAEIWACIEGARWTTTCPALFFRVIR